MKSVTHPTAPASQRSSTEPETLESNVNGTLSLIHAFDIGDAIDLEAAQRERGIHTIQRNWPKYFKSYHTPLALATHQLKNCKSAHLHHFGVLSLVYEVTFNGTLKELRSAINTIGENYKNQSIEDAHSIFRKIKHAITQPKFFQQQSSYVIIHFDPRTTQITGTQLQTTYAPLIASTLRFETQSVSAFQVNDIVKTAISYYDNDLIIVDSESALVFDQEPDEVIDLFELANIQQLELRYFDTLLEKQLDIVYNQAHQPMPLLNYLPFIGTLYDSIGELSRLKVDISVISERLGSSIRLSGEPYFSSLYALMVQRMELETLRQSVEKKLNIIRDVRTIYQYKINSIREDLLSTSVIILIMIELIVALMKK